MPSALADQRFRTQCLRAAPSRQPSLTLDRNKETNKLLVIQPINPSSQSPLLLESKGSQLGLSSYLFVALPQWPYQMISFNGVIIANPKVACFVHPIHSPKGRVFQIGYDNETREKVRSRIFQIIRNPSRLRPGLPNTSSIFYLLNWENRSSLPQN